MLVQYLVGLCALKWHEGVAHLNVTLGDIVPDEASGTTRDVDVTVTIDTPDGVFAFVGYEVKHWASKLDVSDVEALAAKLNDMPSVTDRAIVCTSGYTEPAIKKAAHHGVDLYVLKEWTKPLEEQFPDLAPMKGTPAEAFGGGQFLLTWAAPSFWLTVELPEFHIAPEAPLFDAAGKQHARFPDFATFSNDMLVRSADILWPMKPMQERIEPLVAAKLAREPLPEQPPWPYAHTMDMTNEDVHVLSPELSLHPILAVTVSGELRWEPSNFLYLAMEKVPTGEMFAGALVASSPVPGRMSAIIIPVEGRTLDIRQVRLTREQLNMLKQLELARPESNSGSLDSM